MVYSDEILRVSVTCFSVMCFSVLIFDSKGFPGSQPVSMDKNNLSHIATDPYMVSWKADGTRYMMLIDGKNEIYFVDRDNTVFQVNNLTFPHRKNPSKHICDTLVDGVRKRLAF